MMVTMMVVVTMMVMVMVTMMVMVMVTMMMTMIVVMIRSGHHPRIVVFFRLRSFGPSHCSQLHNFTTRLSQIVWLDAQGGPQNRKEGVQVQV